MSTTGDNPASQARELSNEPLEWDFFLAYASADRSQAESLYAALSTNHRVFLDAHAVRPGDDWSRTISRALAATRLTIFLISANSEEAHYLRDEISTAIQLARKDAKRRRVIPVFLDGFPSNVTAVPYGLGSIQGLDARKLGMEGIAVELRKAVALLGDAVSQAFETSRPAQDKNHTRFQDKPRWGRARAIQLVVASSILGCAALSWGMCSGTQEPPVAQHPQTETGTVEFRVRPYATIFVEGIKLGETPLAPVEMPAGSYTVKIVNTELSKTVTQSIQVSAGRNTLVTINLFKP